MQRCRLTGKWSIEALEVGWNQLLERHESLRTTILEQEGEPFQQVQSHVFRHIPQTNLTDLSLEDREKCNALFKTRRRNHFILDKIL